MLSKELSRMTTICLRTLTGNSDTAISEYRNTSRYPKRLHSSKAFPDLYLRPHHHMRYGATKPPCSIFSETGNIRINVILRRVRVSNVAVETSKRDIF
jgi:hypothetical protein